MIIKIKLGDIAVDVVQKDIKNIHLSIYPPPAGRRVSAPLRINIDTIRVDPSAGSHSQRPFH